MRFILLEALRERRRDWRLTAGFCGVLASALTVAVACLSLASPLLWEPPPFPNARRVVGIRSVVKGVAGGVSWGDANDLRERTPALAKVAVYGTRTWGVQTAPQGHVDVLLSLMATGEFFDVLGLRASAGVPMTTAHDDEGQQQEVWLTSGAAARLFGQPEASLHRAVWLNGTRYRVAGVLPGAFRFPIAQGSPDMIIPLPRGDYCCVRGRGSQQALALVDDAGALDAGLRVASSSLAAEFPDTNVDRRFESVPLRDQVFGARLAALRWIVASAACLLLIASANGAGLWMTRWLRTRRHLAIRLSLGASALRLVAIRATEGALAGLAAAGVAVAAASMLLRTLVAVPFIADRLESFAVWGPIAIEPLVGWTALAAGAAMGLAAASLSHLAVAGRLARLGVREGLTTHAAVRRTRTVLTAIQLAITAIAGWTAIAVGENAHRLLTADRGFETAHTLIAGVGVPEARYDSDARMTAFHADVIEQLAAVPGVVGAGGGVNVPVGNLRTRFLRDGETLARDQQPFARIGVVTPELLPLLRIPLRRGRGLTGDDRLDAPRVALVNEAFVRAHLADAIDPLREGLRLSFYNGFAMKPYTRFQIIGIVGDTRNDTLLVDPQPQIYIPAAQIAMEGFFYVVRSDRSAESILQELTEAVWRVDPAIERVRFRPLSDYVEQALVDRRVVSVFGLIVLIVAATIAAAGLYASLSASLLESTRALAIRAALGATRTRLIGASLRWAFVAAALAIVTTAVAVPVVASRVRLEKASLQPTPTSVLLLAIVMGAVTAAAALRPARRAASVSPADVLRDQ